MRTVCPFSPHTRAWVKATLKNHGLSSSSFLPFPFPEGTLHQIGEGLRIKSLSPVPPVQQEGSGHAPFETRLSQLPLLLEESEEVRVGRGQGLEERRPGREDKKRDEGKGGE